MTTRTQTISLSDIEKNRLDEVAQDAFGTKEVPYGAIVSMLIQSYQNDGEDE